MRFLSLWRLYYRILLLTYGGLMVDWMYIHFLLKLIASKCMTQWLHLTTNLPLWLACCPQEWPSPRKTFFCLPSTPGFEVNTSSIQWGFTNLAWLVAIHKTGYSSISNPLSYQSRCNTTQIFSPVRLVFFFFKKKIIVWEQRRGGSNDHGMYVCVNLSHQNFENYSPE